MRAEPPTPLPPQQPSPSFYPPRAPIHWWGAVRVVTGIIGIFVALAQYGAATSARDRLPDPHAAADVTAIYAHYGFNLAVAAVFVLSVYVLTRYVE